jgi:glutamate/tyrosine decarboxylase-like PLP-dependent enzyme
VDDLERSLHHAAGLIAEYRRGAATARVGAAATREAVAAALDPVLPDDPEPLGEVIDGLVAGAGPGLVCTPGPRYFGFVVGGSVDAALVAEILAAGWDQNAFNAALAPAAIAFEDVAGGWLKELLGLPASASAGFVTGAGAANTVGLAAGRSHVLAARGWDAGRDGLAGAPRVRVVASAERHATVDRALRLLGLGDGTIEEVPALANGEMDPAAVAAALAADPEAPAIVCAQSGNVNTGACDDLRAIAAATREHRAWLHVDGAFGLWAASCPRKAHLVDGVELADSWGCDGHKWLNVPYDSGYAFCAHPEVHVGAMTYTAAYLSGQVEGRAFGGGDFTIESSRRARGFATWAALRSLGRSGVAGIVDRCCRMAERFAERLDALEGFEVANDVVLNQVLVRLGDEELTGRVERAVQEGGICWLGATRGAASACCGSRSRTGRPARRTWTPVSPPSCAPAKPCWRRSSARGGRRLPAAPRGPRSPRRSSAAAGAARRPDRG